MSDTDLTVNRQLKSGAMSFLEACALPDAADERVQDLAGYHLIGHLAAPNRYLSGPIALTACRALGIGFQLTPTTCAWELLQPLAAELAAASRDCSPINASM